MVVPRFLATLLDGAHGPIFGMERWGTAAIRLPRRLARTRLVNVFTSEVVDLTMHRDVPWLLAGNAFQSWPVALMKVLSS